MSAHVQIEDSIRKNFARRSTIDCRISWLLSCKSSTCMWSVSFVVHSSQFLHDDRLCWSRSDIIISGKNLWFLVSKQVVKAACWKTSWHYN